MLSLNNSLKLHRMSYLCEKTCTRLSTSSSSKLNSSMETFMKHKQYQKALDLFEQKSKLRSTADVNMAIAACTRLKDYTRGLNIVEQLSPQTLNNHLIQNALFDLYIQSNDFDNAYRIFSTMKNKSNWTYTNMFKGLISNKMSEKVLDMLDTLTIKPNEFTLAIAFKACAQVNNERAKKIGNQLLSQMPDSFGNDTVLINSAISMSMTFGDIGTAEQLFESIKRKDIVSYGAMIKGYVENDMNEKALDLFEQMPIGSNHVTDMLIFKACAQLADERAKKIGKKLLHQILDKTDVNHATLHSAINMLLIFGDVKHAAHLFQSIKNKSTINYGLMMKSYNENNMSERVLDLFEEMSLTLNNTIYTIVFATCAKLKNERARNIGKQLLDHIPNISEAGNVVLHSAIHMLMRFGDVKDARRLFGLIKEKNVVSYGAMMQGYVENGMSEKALDLFEQMSVNPDNATYSIVFKACAELVDERAKKLGNKLLDQMSFKAGTVNNALSPAFYMLMRFGNVRRVKDLFESIENKDISIYASMMKAYNLNRQPLQCLQLFQTMKQEDLALADEIIFRLPIGACSQIGIRAVCRPVVAQIPSHLYGKQSVSNALIDMWGRTGSAKNAEEIFKAIANPDIVSYNSMINAFGLNGKGLEAVDLFQRIPNSRRNEISYICVLNACSHSGLLNEAHAIFGQIHIKTKRITTTMIDCLSRLFLFNEAEEILTDYEITNTPHSPMYMAILSGARNCRNSVVSEKVYNRMKTLFHDQKDALISGSILLANIYSSLGEDDQVAITRSNQRRNYGNKVKPGLTWTEKDGEIAEFGAHDQSHPLSSEIHDESKQILHEMHQHGFRSDPSWITRPLGEEETIESVLCGHSEKLAIAFHFIRGRRPSFIQATKNLRICGDCHQATKFIAKIRQCEIVLRDANRVHHFSKNGTCSCQDHF